MYLNISLDTATHTNNNHLVPLQQMPINHIGNNENEIAKMYDYMKALGPQDRTYD